jgi:hypothetical protein
VTSDTLLYRQVHPSFIQNGRPTSQVFRPTPKDENKLSVYDGDKIQAKASWEHYTGSLGLPSAGVMAVTTSECVLQSLVVVADGISYPEHCTVNFSGLDRKATEKVAKILVESAIQRGWQYQEGQ